MKDLQRVRQPALQVSPFVIIQQEPYLLMIILGIS